MWEREHDCSWSAEATTYTGCWSRRGCTDARETGQHVKTPLSAGTWRRTRGRGSTTVSGMLLVRATSIYSIARCPPKVPTSPVSSARPITFIAHPDVITY